jgi:hypothetical protein
MAVTAQSIISRVRTQLIDTGTAQRWTDSELLQWLSDGQRTLVSLVPDASAATVTQALTTGSRQTIPSNGRMLLNIVRNMSDNGTTAARAVVVTTRDLLDSLDLNWTAAASEAEVQSYIYDPQQPTVFYVYPPNDGSGAVEMVYSTLPPELTALTENLSVADIYQTALVDYVLHRAYLKDSDFAAGLSLASNYLQLFLAQVGQGQNAELANNPNLQLGPSDPSTKGAAK